MKRTTLVLITSAVLAILLGAAVAAYLFLRPRELVIPDNYHGLVLIAVQGKRADQRVWELPPEGRMQVSPQAFAAFQKINWSAHRANGTSLPVQIAFPNGVAAPPLPTVGLYRLLQAKTQVVYFLGTELEAREAAVDEESLLKFLN